MPEPEAQAEPEERVAPEPAEPEAAVAPAAARASAWEEAPAVQGEAAEVPVTEMASVRAAAVAADRASGSTREERH